MFSSIVEAIRFHAKNTPDATAAVAAGSRFTYRELEAHVRGFAEVLKENGITKGDRVVMRAEQTLTFVTAHFGTHQAGGVFVPAEKGIPHEKLMALAERTDAKLVITEEACEGFTRIAPADVLPLSEAHPDAEPQPLPDREDGAEIMFTTGSTGTPKGVLCAHRTIAAVADNLASGMEYKKDTMMLVPGPVSHANGIRKLSAAFLNGSAVVLADGMTDLNGFFKLLDTYPVTALCLPPSAVRMLLALTKDRLGQYADRIDLVESGTAPLTEADKEKLCALLPNSRLYNSYGLSEAGSSIMLDYNREKGLKQCIGRAARNTKVMIADDDGNAKNATREDPGLIALGGDVLMLGYWKDPETTAEVVKNGYLFTSDMGYIDEDGLIYVLGRRDDVINVGGQKVAPDEVEQAVARLDGIRECACAGASDPISGQTVKLFVVPEPGCAVTLRQIRESLKDVLADYKIPRKLEIMTELPKASNGKLQRKALRERN